jgi:hypothetical protein
VEYLVYALPTGKALAGDTVAVSYTNGQRQKHPHRHRRHLVVRGVCLDPAFTGLFVAVP